LPFGVVSGVGRSRGVSDRGGVAIIEGQETVWGVNVGHHIVTNGDFVA